MKMPIRIHLESGGPPSANPSKSAIEPGVGTGKYMRHLARRFVIKNDHYYLMMTPRGLSGSGDWTPEYRIVRGSKARLNRLEVDKEYLARGRGEFRLEDGHLPEYQKVVSEVDALRWLDQNPGNSVYPIHLNAPEPKVK
jgi:hypothetical protein